MTKWCLNAFTHGTRWSDSLRALTVLVICLLLGSLSLQAQLQTGSFSGTVQDQVGAVVNGAKITLVNQATADSRKTISNDRGYFTIAGVIPGTYSITVESKGFKAWKQSDLALNVGDSRTISGIQLSVGSADEVVVVESGSQEMVPTDNGERSALLTTHDIERLTVQSRELSELLKILPGVTTMTSTTSNSPSTSFTTMGAVGSEIGNGMSTNGAPYRGGTAYILDGANLIDPGANSNSIASVNPDMTAEVKVQTSNFGADNEDGPTIVNVTSKSGGADYHGQGYLYTRNGVLNSNLWTNNHTGTKRTSDEYYYPGGNFGGPVRLPFTDFNKNSKKLLFWAGYEYQWQNPGSSTILQSYIPGADMQKGNFSLDNLTDTSNFDSNTKLCPNGFGSSHAGTWCSNVIGGYDSTGAAITNGSALAVDPGAKALMKFYPAANVDPDKNSGYNYYQAFGGQQNVYIYRVRVDYNINTNNKFFVAYQQGGDTVPIPGMMWWTPANLIPYPGGGMSQVVKSRVLTGNLLTIISPTLTNELVGAWAYVNMPYKANNVAANYSTTIDYPYTTPYTASLLAPTFSGAWDAQIAPNMYVPDLWTGGKGQYNEKKSNATFADNVIRVYKTHTFKAGVFTQLVSDDDSVWDSLNGQFGFASTTQKDALNSSITQMGSTNPTANMVMGIASNFSQANSAPDGVMAARTTAFYVMDDWKATSRLMLNIGWRFDHLGRWYDRADNGMAVWLPDLYDSDVANNTSWPFPGVRWHGVDPGIPNSGSPVRALFSEPRFGLAYDIFGTGKTVLRGGWGLYRWTDMTGGYADPLATAQEIKTYNTPSGNVTLNDVGNLNSSSSSFSASAASSVSAADPKDYEDAGTYAYNFTISQQLPWHSLLEVAYVGNQTKNLQMGGESGQSQLGGSDYSNQNKISVGGLFKSDPVTGAKAPSDPDNTSSYDYVHYFPYWKGYGTNSVTVFKHDGYSNYNSFQIAWVRQTGRLTYNVNYTRSKALGIVGSTIDAFTVHGNYGVLNIDRPNVINTSYSYSFGKLVGANHLLLDGVANGWTISGTTTWQSGFNLQSNNGQNGQNLGMTINNSALNNNESLSTKTWYGTEVGMIMPTTTCDPKKNLSSHQAFNVLCLVPPAVGNYGPRQIGYLAAPGYFNSDLTVFKEFHVHGKQTAEFRAAMFNFLNHPNRDFSTTSLIQPTFTTADEKTFVSTMESNLATGLHQGVPDQKSGYRLGELSFKYNF
jgi:hypothetical protein